MKKLLTFLGCCIATNLLLAQHLQIDWAAYEPLYNSAFIDKIQVDSNYLYLSGSTFSGADTVDFDFTSNVYQHIVNGIGDAYWGKYRKSDMGLEELFLINGNGAEYISDMQKDASGNYYVLCMFDSSNTDIAPLSSQSYLLNTYGYYDIAFAKYSPSGQLIWARHLGGTTNYDGSSEMCLDNYGNLYFGGTLGGTAWIDSTTTQSISINVGTRAPFFAKYDTSGTLQWIKTFSSLNANCKPVSALNQGAVVVLGSFRDSIYIENQWYYEGSGSPVTSFVAVFDTSGSIAWADTIGGSLLPAWYVDENEQSIYLTTDTEDDAKKVSFVKYNLFGNRMFNKTLESTSLTNATSLIVKDSVLYLFGAFNKSITFDTVLSGSSTLNTAYSNCIDMFAAGCTKGGIWQWVERTQTTDSVLGGPRPVYVVLDNNDIYMSIYGLYSDYLGNASIAFTPGSYYIPRSNAIAKYHFTTTGISLIEKEKENTLKLYPNPTQDLLMLQSGQTIDYIEIYDMQGRKILSQKWYGMPVSVAAVPQGVYFVVSFDAAGRQNGQGKLVVSR